MSDKVNKEAEQAQPDEAARHRASAQAHIAALKSFWSTFALTGVIVIAIAAFVVWGGFSWFVSNSQVGSSAMAISPAGQADFALATRGSKPQGVYDGAFGLNHDLNKETIGNVDYYIASGSSSFRLDSDKNFNNYLANADLRPGNRGHFDLYVICRSEKRELELIPVFSAWSGEPNTNDIKLASSEPEGSPIRVAAEFLKGHILLFANMDDKGMYSGNIDYTKQIKVALNNAGGSASQGESAAFSWGVLVYSDDKTAVYRLPIYWVWPDQFGNFIYTGNAYNKNLFATAVDPDDPGKETDYKQFISLMEADATYNRFFFIEGEAVNRPKIETITSPESYQEATKNYELYSGWYNVADEKIGEYISYIQLGFELAQGNTP